MSIELSLYKIADAMQVPLKYEGGTISGGGKTEIAMGAGIKVPVELKATAIFQSEQVGVLFDVAGDLGILVAHYPKSNAVSAYLIDKSKTEVQGIRVNPVQLIAKKATLIGAVKALKMAIVASFFYKSGGWAVLPLPK